VTLKVAGGPPFHGRVTSREPACVANRKVILIEIAPDRGRIDYASGVSCRSAFSPKKAL
jgi:hypothetical protein